MAGPVSGNIILNVIGLYLALGLGLLVLGAELLVRGASRLARAAGLSPLVIGLSVVAFGTSAPELAVSLKACLAGQSDLALGNVLGSNTFNVLFILGLSALITPLAVSEQLVRLDVPLMSAAAALTWLLAANGTLGRLEGLAFLAGGVVYTVFLLRLGRRGPSLLGKGVQKAEEERAARKGQTLFLAVAFTALGLVCLSLGARGLVRGAVDLARFLGVSELVIGLSVVAAGTSLPEAATSVVASLRGERDLAVGNVVGSNIFNLLVVLGASAAISGRVRVAPAALHFDLPLMVATALVCLPIFFTGGRISRGEGGLFLAGYTAYLAFLFFGWSP